MYSDLDPAPKVEYLNVQREFSCCHGAGDQKPSNIHKFHIALSEGDTKREKEGKRKRRNNVYVHFLAGISL